MPATTFVAHRPGSFAALVQSADLGGLRLHPLPPVRVRDRFYDTADGELLQQGITLRVRDQDGTRTAALRPVATGEGPSSLPADVDLPAVATGRFDLPPSPLATYVRGVVGQERLTRLLALRQYRTPRVAFRDEEAAGLVSFDVVVYEVPGAEIVSNEVEVEPMGRDGLLGLVEALREHGLEPTAESKFARGVVRLTRSLAEPVLLLPRERRQLEAAVSSGSPMLNRRARILLLDARGVRPDTIAAQTGLSMARVRYWRQLFRDVRLGILGGVVDPPVTPTDAEEGGVPAPADAARPEPDAPATPRPVDSSDAGKISPTSPDTRGEPTGDGLSAADADPGSSHDMADLLAMFSPSGTTTPLLDEHGPDDDDLPPDDDAPGETLPLFSQLFATNAPDVKEPTPRKASYPVLLGPFAQTVSAGRNTVGRSVRRRTSGAAAPGSRPQITGETPLVEAAASTLGYYVSILDATLDRLAAQREDRDLWRALVSVHRVRLVAETFESVLTERAAARLLSAIRPAAVFLDAALDLTFAARTDDDLAGRRDEVRDAIVARYGAPNRPWSDLASRMLRRLRQQAADGTTPLDLPLPADDFYGEPDLIPGPARLQHVLGSTIWSRFEAVRAYEKSLVGDPDPDLAYHLAMALGALQFTLGLATAAAPDRVNALQQTAANAERRVAQYRRDWRTWSLVSPGSEEPNGAADVRSAWETVTARAYRAQLAQVIAEI